jgi:hypothetical protein
MFGCPDKEEEPNYFLAIINNSDKDLLFQMDKLFPDTTLWLNNPFTTYNINDFTIKAGSEKKFGFWEEQFQKMDDDQKFRLFIFDKQVIESTSWESVANEYLILRRYEFNFEDLINIDWEIKYP